MPQPKPRLKNQPTRDMEEIFAPFDKKDPDAEEKRRIKENREKREKTKEEDLGI